MHVLLWNIPVQKIRKKYMFVLFTQKPLTKLYLFAHLRKLFLYRNRKNALLTQISYIIYTKMRKGLFQIKEIFFCHV